MALNDEFTLHTIKGKDVYVVDDHHRVLAAWAGVRRCMAQPPNLITIDHHTDTHEAFLGYAHVERYEDRVKNQEALMAQLSAQVDWASDASLLSAIGKLRHDEHIHAATMSGVLGHAFCIQLSDSGGVQSVEQEAYAAAADRIYVIPAPCFVGCVARSHNDDCVIRHANEIIEARYLDDQLVRGSEISVWLGLAGLEAAPYILDIDLDAFHSRKAIGPDDPSTFYRLIKNAVAITIATEAECVEELWHDESDRMTSGDLLAEVMHHIDEAMQTK